MAEKVGAFSAVRCRAYRDSAWARLSAIDERVAGWGDAIDSFGSQAQLAIAGFDAAADSQPRSRGNPRRPREPDRDGRGVRATAGDRVAHDGAFGAVVHQRSGEREAFPREEIGESGFGRAILRRRGAD